jgi:hypothetical protein
MICLSFFRSSFAPAFSPPHRRGEKKIVARGTRPYGKGIVPINSRTRVLVFGLRRGRDTDSETRLKGVNRGARERPSPPSPVAVTELSRPRTRRNSFASRVVASLARSSELVENRGERLGFNSLFSRKTFKPTPFVIVSTGRKTLNLCCWYPESDLFFDESLSEFNPAIVKEKQKLFWSSHPTRALRSFAGFRRASRDTLRARLRRTSASPLITSGHTTRTFSTDTRARTQHPTTRRTKRRPPGAERGHTRFFSHLSLISSFRLDSIRFRL